ncbi:YgjV family protein [Aeromonas salmonicida]|uniref:YgjV family protein n=1 Tax=Aeromonas salmonicida TaxID=645 RepID=UPI00223F8C90|nr:YgjV family protein [Aeromonas salmonicida]
MLLQDHPFFAQLIVLLACLMGASAFLQRQDKQLRAQLTLNGLLMGMHFLLLGSPASAINTTLSAVRTLVSGYYRGKGVMIFFLVTSWLLVLPKLTHPMQLLPLLGTTLTTYALFRLESLSLRLCMLASSIGWLAHNLWGGIMLESLVIVLNGHTRFHLYRQRRAGLAETSSP